jgi:hypothetical protein
MKNPETTAPSATMIEDSQCRPRLTRCSPNRNRPRNDDSAKNANTPSMNSVCPTTGPAKCEKRAQLVPNWNSIGIPVTTPVAKVMAKMRAQKRAARPYSGLSERISSVLKSAISTPSPMVSTGKR